MKNKDKYQKALHEANELVDALEVIANLTEKQIGVSERLATIDDIYRVREIIKRLEYFV